MFLWNKFVFVDSGLKNDKWGELLSPRKKQQASELDVEGVERRWRQPEHSGGWRGGLGPAFHEDF